MSVQRGKDLLLKVDLDGAGQFETVAGLRATRISFNSEQVDVTSLESTGGWRELCFVMRQRTSGRGRYFLTANSPRFRY